jgi:hypothetical protein
MDYAIGITENGERLRFERWLYETWREGSVTDPMLLASLRRCVRFVVLW